MELISAAKNGNFDLVFSLLTSGYSANARDKDNATALYWSACHGHVNLCEVLIQAGSDVNARVTWGSTSLHAAADRGHVQCVETLINSGANIHSQNNRGDTALHIASYRGFVAITNVLLTAGANVCVRNEKGKTAEEEALEGGHREIVVSIARACKAKQPPATFTSIATVPILPQHVTSNAHTQHPSNDVNLVTSLEMSPKPPRYEDLDTSYVSSSYSSSYKDSLTTTIESSSTSTDSEDSTTDQVDAPAIFRRHNTEKHKPIMRHAPVPLKRSISVGGHDFTQHLRNMQAPPVPFRTNSIGNIATNPNGHCRLQQIQHNDINRSYSSLDSLNNSTPMLHPAIYGSNQCMSNSYSSNSVAIEPPQISYWGDNSLQSTMLTSNGRCVATESADYGNYNHDASTEHSASPIPRDINDLRRPLRSSIGSVREIRSFGDTQDEYIKTLKNQLVEAYRQIDKLTKEKENLEFQCSTLLNQLTETERDCEQRITNFDSLRDSVELNGKHSVNECRREPNIPDVVIHANTTSTHGFEMFSRMIADGLSQDKLSYLHDVLEATVKSLMKPHDVFERLDLPNKEWQPGVDYVILGDNPVHFEQGDSKSKGYICFLVKHIKTGRRLHLKMLMMSQPLQEELRQKLETNKDTLSHKYILPILHMFEGSTERFKKFLTGSLLTKNEYSTSLCNRATFIVQSQTTSFSSVMNTFKDYDNVGISLVLYGFYNILSALASLEEKHILPGCVNSSSIVIDDFMNVYLDFVDIFAKMNDKTLSLCNANNEKADIVYVNHHGILGGGTRPYDNNHNIKRLNSTLGEMFNTWLLGYKTEGAHMTSHERALRHGLQLVTSNCAATNSFKHILRRMGYMVCVPPTAVLTHNKDCGILIQTLMLKLLSTLSSSNGTSLSTTDMINRHTDEVMADFLSNISPADLIYLHKNFRAEFKPET